jgi:hypothetical protein
MAGYQVIGNNAAAGFTLKIHRGEGMALLAMNWRNGEPPDDFVGFAIDYQEPGTTRWLNVRNRLTFEGTPNPNGYKSFSTHAAPIQKFRWVVFPFNAELPGQFVFRVTPVFMADDGRLSEDEAQTAKLELARHTYDKLNVSFTRGYVASQAFVDKYSEDGPISSLLPPEAKAGLDFKPTHPKSAEALAWMGAEARREVLAVLDEAVADATAQVRVIAYDLSAAEVFDRLKALGNRLKIIIDDSKDHKPADSGETQAEQRLIAAGATVKRQHMGKLQHNKVIIADGVNKRVVCGSTNFTWRGLYVQSNHAVVASGSSAIQPFKDAFDAYWTESGFRQSVAADWKSLGLNAINLKVAFSPHGTSNSKINSIAQDIAVAQTSVFYSLAFLSITPGAVTDALEAATNSDLFVYGISDKRTGFTLLKPDGNPAPVYFSKLDKNLPPPFKPEPNAGQGTNVHHKFVVLDFNTPNARVWFGSYNFSNPADGSNGENLLLAHDRKIATSFMVEAVRLFDHYHFRVVQREAKRARKPLELRRCPAISGVDPWWREDYSVPYKIRDRELFA